MADARFELSIKDFHAGANIFIYEKPVTSREKDWEGLRAELASRSAGAVVGVSVSTGNRWPSEVASAMQAISQLPIRICDPQVYRVSARFEKITVKYKNRKGNPASRGELHEIPGRRDVGTETEWIPRREARSAFRFLREIPSDDSERAQWIQSVVQHQIDHDASVVLAPTEWLDAQRPSESLDAMERDLATTFSRNIGLETFASVAFNSEWLSRADLRSQLLLYLRASPHRSWYMRVLWPELSPGKQLADPDLLAGYVALSRALDLESKNLILPASDLTGWMLLHHGNRGFGTSLDFSARTYHPKLGGGGGGSEKTRVFDPALLATFEREDQDAIGLLNPQPARSRNRYTRTFGDPSLTPVSAKYDYVVQALELLGSVHGRAKSGEVMTRIDSALELSELAFAGERRKVPNHLSAWLRA